MFLRVAPSADTLLVHPVHIHTVRVYIPRIQVNPESLEDDAKSQMRNMKAAGHKDVRWCGAFKVCFKRFLEKSSFVTEFQPTRRWRIKVILSHLTSRCRPVAIVEVDAHPLRFMGQDTLWVHDPTCLGMVVVVTEICSGCPYINLPMLEACLCSTEARMSPISSFSFFRREYDPG